jgi:3-dehydrosphinganine reductase
MIARASDVRVADKTQRKLMQIEMAAKQLALHIAEYEDMVSGQEQADGSMQGQLMDHDSA